jgi:ABC-type phosphate/phosphonate transport system substrate-binding protein
VPADMLFNKEMHPLNAFPRVEFAGGHDKAAIAVYEGRADVGAGHDGVIIDLSHKPGYGDADQVLVNLAWSEEIPSDPVAVFAPDAKLRGHIRDALCQVAKPGEPKSKGNLAVERFWGTAEGFEPIAPKAYEVLFDPMKRLGLRPSDMMRK